MMIAIETKNMNLRIGGLLALLLALLVCVPVGAQTTVELGLGEADVVLQGDAGDATGERMASGDFNGDGIADIAISAPQASPGGRIQAGKVYVVLGSASLSPTFSLASSAAMTILGRAANDGMGNWLSSGDINGDGFDDLLVGAKNADYSSRVNCGAAYVFYGAASLPATVDMFVDFAGLEIYGAGTSNFFGSAVAAGDVDGDEVADLVVTATYTWPLGRANAGSAYLFYGDPTGGLPSTIDLASTLPDIEIYGKQAQDQIGSSLATGDMNNDGFDDIIIGSSTAPAGAFNGEAYVVLGRDRTAFAGSLDLATDTDLCVTGAVATDFLAWVVSTGDLNADGFSDLLIGAPNATGLAASSGIAYVILGSGSIAGTLDLASVSASVTVLGAVGAGYLGWEVRAMDMDGDGFEDLVVSAPYVSPGSGALAGEVYRYNGETTLAPTIDPVSDTPDLTVRGATDYESIGTGMAGADINDDGFDDLMIGASASDLVYIVFGAPPFHLEVSMPDLSSQYDQTVTVPVSLDYIGDGGIEECELHIAFDTQLLSLSTVNPGALTSAWTLGTTVVPGSGTTATVVINGDNPGPPLTSTGEFLQLDFAVQRLSQPITSPVSFEYMTYNQSSSPFDVMVDGSVALLGNEGEVAATFLSEPGDPVRVRVIDPDLDLDPGAIETCSVSLTNTVNGEQETLLLTEEGINSGVFFSSIPTVFGSVAGTDGDGEFNTQPGDQLQVAYTDELNALGAAASATATHTVEVLGDADGSGELNAFDSAVILAHSAERLTLTGRDALVSNLDIDAPETEITAFDAVLAIQRRLNIISIFPLQEPGAKNHPQPESLNNAKPVFEERYLTLASVDDYISVRAEQRAEILAADLVLEGIVGQVEMGPEMDLFEVIFRQAEDGLHVAFAGPRAIEGPGELFRIYSNSSAAQVQELSGNFNGGRIAAYLEQSSPLEVQPLRLTLHPNTPNPFNAETLIRFDLPAAQNLSLDVYNALGQKVRTLVQGRREGGSHLLRWDGRNDQGQRVATGPYFYRLTAGHRIQTQRMLLLK